MQPAPDVQYNENDLKIGTYDLKIGTYTGQNVPKRIV